MIQKNYIIADEAGMHMRPATQLANLCQAYACSATLGANGQEFDAKSAMSLLLAGIACNTPVKICFDGPDEAAALRALEEALLGELFSPAKDGRRVKILAPGIALAPAAVLPEKSQSCTSAPALGPEQEMRRFLDARYRVMQDCQEQAAQLSGAQAEILLAHSHLAAEPMLSGAVLQHIEDVQCCAETAVEHAIAALTAQFESRPGSLLAQRSADLKDIQRRLIQALSGNGGVHRLETEAIIVAH